MRTQQQRGWKSLEDYQKWAASREAELDAPLVVAPNPKLDAELAKLKAKYVERPIPKKIWLTRKQFWTAIRWVFGIGIIAAILLHTVVTTIIDTILKAFGQ
jgi:hypothetical protein